MIGLGRKKKDFHANIVLARAIQMGLVALARLASCRVDKETRPLADAIQKIWDTAQALFRASSNPRDFSAIQAAESNLRKLFLDILWYSTIRFGNKEKRRIYSWREGTVGPLNALLNYAGARLRELATTRYPIEEPTQFQIRTYADGSVKVLPKRVALKIGPDDAVKVEWNAGYNGNARYPRVFLTHPTLPSLDFVDMIRAHVIELCRQCFIYAVPRTEAHRYIRLLIHRLRPFLDWVYTEGREGRSRFNPEADAVLREIVLELRSLYGQRVGHRDSVTRELDDASLSPREMIRNKVQDQLKIATGSMKQRYLDLLDMIDTGTVQDRDVEKLMEQILSESSRAGTDWHQVLLSDMHHPKSLKQVVYAGDTMLREESSFLTVAELPVGAGKIDLTLFIRREVPGRTLWTPVAILEIKTKTAFDFNLYGVRTKAKTKQDYVPSFYAWRRELNDTEWDTITSSTPSQRTTDQLSRYEQVLLHEYRSIASGDPTPPTSLWRGVIFVDPEQKMFPAAQGVLQLIDELTHAIANDQLFNPDSRTYILDHEEAPWVALYVDSAEGPVELLQEASPGVGEKHDDPFRARQKDDRFLTLYIPVSSSTSQGKSAAWWSTGWHLLHHLQELTKLDPKQIVWLDLLGNYPSERLLQRRFGLDHLHRSRLVTEVQYRGLTSFLDTISFVDLSSVIADMTRIGDLDVDTLASTLKDIGPDHLVVIDGWPDLRDMIPAHSRHLVRGLEVALLDILSEPDLIWIDSGTQHTLMNSTYQRRGITPLPHDSPRRPQLDEILYNLPSPPRRFGWSIPQEEAVRVIVQDLPAETLWSCSIHVPHLVGITRRFQGLKRKRSTLSLEEVHTLSPFMKMYGSGVLLKGLQAHTPQDRQTELDAMQLIPSLFRRKTLEPIRLGSSSFDIAVRKVRSQQVTLAPRMALCIDRSVPCPPRGTKNYVVASQITRPWYYDRTPPSGHQEVYRKRRVQRPPVVGRTETSSIDTKRQRWRELYRVLTAAQYILGQSRIGIPLRDLCERIVKVCQHVFHSKPGTRGTYHSSLVQVKQLLASHPCSRQLWNLLLRQRQHLAQVLNSEHRAILDQRLADEEALLLLYGNNLFLVILCIIDVQKDLVSSHIMHLWNAVSEWVLYQLGFTPQDDRVNHRYDLHAIHSSLLTRIKELQSLPIPAGALDVQYSGQIIWMEDDGLDACLALSSERGLQYCFLSNLASSYISGWNKGITTPNEVRELAQRALISQYRTPIVLTRDDEHEVLWMQTDEEEWIAFQIEYTHRTPTTSLLPWVKLTPLTDSDLIPPMSPSDVSAKVDVQLREYAMLHQEAIPVGVTVDIHRGQYRVRFTNADIEEQVQLVATQDLIRVLRTPFTTGLGYLGRSGKLLTWDHLKDIEYHSFRRPSAEVELVEYLSSQARSDIPSHTEEISLSFLLPLVHRSRFYPDVYTIPETSTDLLDCVQGPSIALHLFRHEGGFRVRLQDLPDYSHLKNLEDVEFDLYSLALLCEITELVDHPAGIRYLVTVNADQVQGYIRSVPVKYHVLREALQRADPSAFDWSQNKWALSVQFDQPVVRWQIIDPAKQPWMRREGQFRPGPHQTVSDLLTSFQEEIQKTIPLEYVTNLTDIVDRLASQYMEWGWGSSAPTYHGEIEAETNRIRIVILREGNDKTYIVDSLDIALPLQGDLDVALEAIECDSVLTQYSVTNSEDLLERICQVIDAWEEQVTDDRETELIDLTAYPHIGVECTRIGRSENYHGRITFSDGENSTDITIPSFVIPNKSIPFDQLAGLLDEAVAGYILTEEQCKEILLQLETFLQEGGIRVVH